MGDHPATDADDMMNIQWGLDYIKDHCQDKSKLTMGLATYGKGWLDVPKQGTPPGMYQQSTASSWAAPGTWEDGTFSIWDIEKNLLPGCTRTWDNYSHTPTLYCDTFPKGGSNAFVSYEDAESWAYKMKVARDFGMSGAIIWASSDMKGEPSRSNCILSNRT
eukprot:Gregarina_sp_Poly_1__3359@NODE_196_length_11576_cov_92_095925_g175_i0_p12_GENE_NODE_196_length_11576_cov_92_095925_g175_i0NODE_196_length_11576_cov_92_095925_g175_i0_p12_ORF_typecomplete_len162_score15_99Glyco_hydro_18/PF00704_28/6_2e18_NODE_196_length_11576_cov_92_095925_g175_i083898874